MRPTYVNEPMLYYLYLNVLWDYMNQLHNITSNVNVNVIYETRTRRIIEKHRKTIRANQFVLFIFCVPVSASIYECYIEFQYGFADWLLCTCSARFETDGFQWPKVMPRTLWGAIVWSARQKFRDNAQPLNRSTWPKSNQSWRNKSGDSPNQNWINIVCVQRNWNASQWNR